MKLNKIKEFEKTLHTIAEYYSKGAYKEVQEEGLGCCFCFQSHPKDDLVKIETKIEKIKGKGENYFHKNCASLYSFNPGYFDAILEKKPKYFSRNFRKVKELFEKTRLYFN